MIMRYVFHPLHEAVKSKPQASVKCIVQNDIVKFMMFFGQPAKALILRRVLDQSSQCVSIRGHASCNQKSSFARLLRIRPIEPLTIQKRQRV
jgi:hypothetical protein